METLLEAMLAGNGFTPGQSVILTGLVSKPELNGVEAVVLSTVGVADGRVIVQTKDGYDLKIKPTNQIQLDHEGNVKNVSDVRNAEGSGDDVKDYEPAAKKNKSSTVCETGS